MAEKIKQKQVEDAEIIVSTDLDGSEEKDKKSNSTINSKAEMFRGWLFNAPKNIIFLVQSIVLICLCFGFYKYSEIENLEFRSEIISQITSLTPKISLEEVQVKLDQVENRLKKENISYVDSSKRELEKIISNKVSNLGNESVDKKRIVFLENSVSKLENLVSETLSDLKAIREDYSGPSGERLIGVAENKSKLSAIENSTTDQFKRINLALTQLEADLNSLQENYQSIDFAEFKEPLSPKLDIIMLNSIQKSFSKYAYEALKQELIRNSDKNLFSYIIATIRSVFVVRSVTPQIGMTTDAILSRAEYQLREGNVKSCLRELEDLDVDSQKVFSSWTHKMISLIES